jgi:DNA replication protein DnaC
MERLAFRNYLEDCEGLSREEIFERSARMHMESYNSLPGEDDGSGVDCPICRNRGNLAFFNPETKNMSFRQCGCRPERDTALRLRKIGLLERSRRDTLDRFVTDTPVQRTLKECVEGYISAPEGRWLALFGQSGVGKTHLCTAAFCALVRSLGAQGEYLRWVTDGRAIKAGALEPGSALFDRYRDAPLLYIDDLFKKRADAPVSDADLRLCFELLDARYNARLPTILSCELTFEELAALDEAVAGRIREMCGPFLVSVDRDLRKNYRLRAT